MSCTGCSRPLPGGVREWLWLSKCYLHCTARTLVVRMKYFIKRLEPKIVILWSNTRKSTTLTKNLYSRNPGIGTPRISGYRDWRKRSWFGIPGLHYELNCALWCLCAQIVHKDFDVGNVIGTFAALTYRAAVKFKVQYVAGFSDTAHAYSYFLTIQPTFFDPRTPPHTTSQTQSKLIQVVVSMIRSHTDHWPFSSILLLLSR